MRYMIFHDDKIFLCIFAIAAKVVEKEKLQASLALPDQETREPKDKSVSKKTH